MNSYRRKTVVHDDKAAKMRRYIAADYMMLHNVVWICHIMLHNFASVGEKVCAYRQFSHYYIAHMQKFSV